MLQVWVCTLHKSLNMDRSIFEIVVFLAIVRVVSKVVPDQSSYLFSININDTLCLSLNWSKPSSLAWP